MTIGNRVIFLGFLALLSALPWTGAAQEAVPEEEQTADETVFRLPETEVTAEQDRPELLTQEEMEREGAQDLWEAVRYIPGVMLSGGGRRNDANFTVRGFGVDRVPIFVDGIVMANPYRGEGDSARFLSGDLESLEIQKGYSSLLLGANTIGGAIVMRTAKPKDPFEASVQSSVDFDGVFKYAANTQVLRLGTKQRLFYGKAVFQYRNVDHYRLPETFEASPQNPQETGDRLWSDAEDLKLTLIAGLTPAANLDIWLTYIYQDADKGFSPPDVRTREYQIWNWPFWKRQSVSLNSAFSRGDFSIDALFYFDQYDNRLDEYYNWKAYELGIHGPHSDYDEYTLGGRLTGAWDINDRNNLQGALTYKKEDHRGLRGSILNEEDLTEEMHVNEDTWSLAAEYSTQPWTPLTLKAGLGFDALLPQAYWNQENEYLKLLDARYFVVQTRTMFLYTWQAGIFYQIRANHRVHLTYARKNHFPTMAQRYSTRFGSTLPNPGLGPEIANHFELGYTGSFAGMVSLHTAVYYSALTGKVVTVQLPNPHYPSASVDYARNLDKTAFYGIEISPEWYVNDYLSGGAAFSLNRYTIDHSQNGISVITYYPEITANGYMVIKPAVPMVSIIPRIEYIGSRYADTAGATLLEGYFLMHLKVTASLGKHVTLSLALENLLDTYYEIRQYAPLAGRSYNATLTARY
jgi:iron complex outermembrane receptor protein